MEINELSPELRNILQPNIDDVLNTALFKIMHQQYSLGDLDKLNEVGIDANEINKIITREVTRRLSVFFMV